MKQLKKVSLKNIKTPTLSAQMFSEVVNSPEKLLLQLVQILPNLLLELPHRLQNLCIRHADLMQCEILGAFFFLLVQIEFYIFHSLAFEEIVTFYISPLKFHVSPGLYKFPKVNSITPWYRF